MTKIPSVKERVSELELCECENLSGESQTDRITQALTADRTALILEVRKVLASEGVLSMSVEKALAEINPTHKHTPMTKIPSVEEKVEEFYFRYVIQPLVGSERLDGVAKEAVSFFREALTADRTAILTELSEHVNQIAYHDDWDCHVLDYDKIKAYLDELINPTV